jgi:hypothetical protein
MSDLEYESDNKEVLEKCCMVIEYHQNKHQEEKEAKHTTRSAIQHRLEEKRLRKDAELDY